VLARCCSLLPTSRQGPGGTSPHVPRQSLLLHVIPSWLMSCPHHSVAGPRWRESKSFADCTGSCVQSICRLLALAPCCVHNGSMHFLAARCLNVITTQPWRHCEGLCYGTAEAGNAIWVSAACARGQKFGTVSVMDAHGRPRRSEILCSHIFRGAKRGLQPARPRCPGANGAARSMDLGIGHQPGLTLLTAANARPSRDLRVLQQLAQRG